LELPVEDGSFDAAISVFGVIFAPDADRVVAELLRVAGRLALSSWLPIGPIAAAGRILMSALPAPPWDPPRWGDPDWVSALLERHGAEDVEVAEAALAFTAGSPAAWLEDQERHHPVWIWGRRTLGEARWAALREESLAALEAGNEAPGAFRTTSRYLVVTARAG
jgi:SAM-dependent methyltransferase